MYNALNRSVSCDLCKTSIAVDAHSISSAEKVVEKEGWAYAGLGQFRCPKCIGKGRKKS